MKQNNSFEISKARGFTLLEVLIATMIFLIVSTALFVTFRTGIHAWRGGHAASETFQTIRIAQDVIIRDLQNIAYRPDEEYNRTYRQQVALAAMREGGQISNETEYQNILGGIVLSAEEVYAKEQVLSDLLKIPPPTDLSFHGDDSEKLDTVTFTRFRGAMSGGKDTSGFRRVKYSVTKGVLYREESTPAGYHPSEQFDDPDHFSPSRALARHFYSKDDAAKLDTSSDGLLDIDDMNFLPPDEDKASEPLCEGVEVFNVTYGYFRSGEWKEVEDWDSSRYHYRYPLEDGATVIDPVTGAVAATPGGGAAGQGSFPASPRAKESAYDNLRGRKTPKYGIAGGQPITFMPRPDNLPGYIAIQLGLRDPEGKGPLRSFTIMVSCPIAREEVDPTAIEVIEGGVSRDTPLYPQVTDPKKLR